MYNILLEGGYGHIQHVYENSSLKISDIKNIIDLALNNKLHNTQLKTDGLNLLVSYKNNQFIFARNNTHIKNFGEKALTLDDLKEFLNKLPDNVYNVFVDGANIIINVLDVFPDTYLNNLFESGKKFLSIEIINPKSKNVIDYLRNIIVLHSITEYDKKAIRINEDREIINKIYSKLVQNKKIFVNKYEITKLKNAIFDSDLIQYKNAFDTYLNTFIKKYNLTDSDTIEKYKINWVVQYIEKYAEQNNLQLESDFIEVLLDRWIYNKTDLRLIDIGKYYSDDIKYWVKSVDENIYNINYKINKPLKYLFEKLGVIIIDNLSSHISDNIKLTKEIFIEDYNKVISDIRKNGSLQQQNKLNLYISDSYKISNKKQIELVEEGITFNYNNDLYKLTGYFGMINQIFGMLKYNRNK